MIYQGTARYPVTEIILHCADTRPHWMTGRSLAEKVAEIRIGIALMNRSPPSAAPKSFAQSEPNGKGESTPQEGVARQCHLDVS